MPVAGPVYRHDPNVLTNPANRIRHPTVIIVFPDANPIPTLHLRPAVGSFEHGAVPGSIFGNSADKYVQQLVGFDVRYTAKSPTYAA